MLVSVFRRGQRQWWLDLTTVIGYTVDVAVGIQLFVLLASTTGHFFGQKAQQFRRADAVS